MNILKRRFILAILFLVSFSLLFVKISHAQLGVDDENTLEVTPITQEFAVDPGETFTVSATLRNRTDETLPIGVRVQDFTAQGEEGNVRFVEEGPWSISTWSKIDITDFEIAPGEEKKVTATITIPREDNVGGRYGAFVFTVKNDAGKQQNNAALLQEISSLFLIKINGIVDESLLFTEFNAPQFSEFGPIPLELKFQNQGNTHVRVAGLVNVTDMFGNKVADVVINGTNVFPAASRAVTVNLEKRYLMGAYQALAIVYYGSTNQSVTETTTFFVFPVRIFVAILIVFILLYMVRKRIYKALRALSGK